MIIGYTVSEIWCMTDVIVIFHFGLFFTLLPLTDRKIKNSRKWKKGLEISSFYTIVPKIMIKCYTVPEICHMADVTYFSFWTIFCCYPPNSLKNQNFKKMKKKPGDIIILHKCTKNHDHMLYCSYDMARDT